MGHSEPKFMGDVFHIGTAECRLVPHHVPDIGPRITLTLDDSGQKITLIITPGDLRGLSTRMVIAACEAEAKQHHYLHRHKYTGANP